MACLEIFLMSIPPIPNSKTFDTRNTSLCRFPIQEAFVMRMAYDIGVHKLVSQI